jgi:hypothetical protein
VNLTLKMAEYLLKGVDRLMGADPNALPAPPATPGRTDRFGALCQKKNLTMLKKVLSGQKAIEDRKQGRVNDLLRQKAHAIKAFNEKLVKLGWKPEGAPASRKKATAFATGTKNA